MDFGKEHNRNIFSLLKCIASTGRIHESVELEKMLLTGFILSYLSFRTHLIFSWFFQVFFVGKKRLRELV